MAKFKSKKTIITIIIIVGLLLLCAYPAFAIYEETTYEKYAGEQIYYEMNPQILVSYKNEVINMAEYDNSAIVAHFQCLPRKLYFDYIADSQNKITITVPNKIDLIISPKDASSIFLEFDMKKGIDRKYVLDRLNFNGLLDILYEITGNDIFLVR